MCNVSIIIPVFNQLEYTRDCLDTLYKNTDPAIPFEVIVVDNGSTDSTPGFLKEAGRHFSNFTVVTNPENLGFARACNTGARAAQGQYLFFLNNDTQPQPNWLSPLTTLLDSDPHVAAVGSKLLFPDLTIQHAGVIIIQDLRLAIDPGITHIYYQHPHNLQEACQMRVYPALTAAALLVRASAFHLVHGFDENYWNGYEDIDLCFKLRQAGYLLVYQPNSIIIHYESTSGRERFIRSDENFRRLMSIWAHRPQMQADFVRRGNTPFLQTPTSIVRPYEPLPLSAQSNRAISRRLPLTFIPATYLSFLFFHLGEQCHLQNRSNWKNYYCKALKLLIKKKPHTPYGLYSIASIYKRLGRYQLAILWFLKLAERDLSPAMQANRNFHIGECLAILGQPEQALNYLERCLHTLPDHQKARQLLNKINANATASGDEREG